MDSYRFELVNRNGVEIDPAGGTLLHPDSSGFRRASHKRSGGSLHYDWQAMRYKNNQWKVYVIRSKEGLVYTGITTNLTNRLKQHNSGSCRWTSRGSAWQIVYSEECENSKVARQRERYFKNRAGKEWLHRRGFL